MNDSQLYLLSNVEIDADNEFTIDFDNATAQQTYFQSKISDVLDTTGDFSYIRKDADVKVEKSLEDLLSVNYLMFKNDSKWWYARITNKEYISPTTTRIYFEIDAFQTFMFDFEIQESFIDREHQDRYVKGKTALLPQYNRETENIEKGTDFLKSNKVKISDNIPDDFTVALGVHADRTFQLFWVTIVCKESIGKKSWSTAGGLISGSQPSETKTTSVKGMPTNVFTYVAPLCLLLGSWLNAPVFRCTSTATSTNVVPTLTLSQLKDMTEDPKVISINIGRYCPFEYGCIKDKESGEVYDPTRYKLYPLPAPEGNLTSDINLSCYEWNNSEQTGSGAIFFINNPNQRSQPILSTPHDLSLPLDAISISNLKNIEYEPKLNTPDYSYYQIEMGSQKIKLNKDDFQVDSLQLELNNSYSVKNGRSIIPLNYKGQERCTSDALSYDSITNEVPLRTDAWMTYLSENKSSMVSGFVTNALQSIISGGIGVATGGIGFAVAGTQALGFFSDIANNIAQINDLKNKPDEVKQTTMDVVLDYSMKDLYINLSTFELRPQFKNRAFNYFYHYGYKVNDFKKPNYRSRYYFNYLKTIGVNIKSNIDSIYVNELKSMFNNGVTIWHYRDSTTWKGTNNYDYENAEMNLISTEVENG